MVGQHWLANPKEEKLWYIQLTRHTYKNFNQIVCAGGSNKVFIFIEIYAENIVCMRMNLLDILARSNIPNSTHLVASATREYALMSWVPDSLIGSMIVIERGDTVCAGSIL